MDSCYEYWLIVLAYVFSFAYSSNFVSGIMGLTVDAERYPSSSADTGILAEKTVLPFSGLTVPSRLVKAPMAEDLSSWDQANIERSGIPSDQLIRVYEEWGKGGYGMLISRWTPVIR